MQVSNKLSIMSHSVLANNKIPPVLVARYLTKSEIDKKKFTKKHVVCLFAKI